MSLYWVLQVIEGTSQYLDWAGNLVPLLKQRKQHSVDFHAFKDNRVALVVRIRDPQVEPRGRLLCMREPRAASADPARDGEPQQQQTPICALDVSLPLVVYREKSAELEDDEELEDESVGGWRGFYVAGYFAVCLLCF